MSLQSYIRSSIDKNTPSTLPSRLSLLCLFIALIFSFTHDIIEVVIRVPTVGELSLPGSVTFNMYIFGWALPLIISIGIAMISTNARGTMHPAFPNHVNSPASMVKTLQIFLVVSNLFAFAMVLVSKFALPQYPNLELIPYNKFMVFRLTVGRSAMPAFYNIGWTLITAVRHPALNPIQSALGLAYEHTVVLHRLLGWMSMFWLSCHSIGYLVVYIVEKTILVAFIPNSPTNLVHLTGLVAFILLIVMTLSSLPRIRRSTFQIFTYFHWLWVPFLLISILHIPTYFPIILPPLFIFFVDRLACVYGNLAGIPGSKRVTATLVRVSDDAVAVLIPVGPLLSSDVHVLDTELAQIYTPGRFVCLGLASDMVGVVPMHPFSIASYSVPNRTMSIVIRALGPWTRRLHMLATRTGSFVQLRIGGPYSISGLSYDDLPLSRGVLIAGGVGVSKYMGRESAIRSGSNNYVPIATASSEQVPPETATESSSVTTTNSGSNIWLCKDANEYLVYASLGADLSEWNVFCSKGFESDAIPSSFPLSAQTIYLPYNKRVRLGLAVFYAGVYAALSITCREIFVNKIVRNCTDNNSTKQWIYCSRGFGLLLYSVNIIFIPLVIVVTSVILSTLRSIKRPASTFTCHALPTDLVKHARRFDLSKDVPIKYAYAGSNQILRSCTSKPLRNCIQKLTAEHKVGHVDDGIGF